MTRKPGYEPKRRTHNREPLPRFVIYCEGERTEVNYFNAFRLSSLRVIQVTGEGFNTDSLVRRFAARIAKEREAHPEDQHWAVFDRDSFGAEQVNLSFQRAAQSGIRVAFSNEAFELWYWLHFDFLNAPVSRSDYQAKLTRRLGRPYRKNDPGLYPLLNEVDPDDRNDPPRPRPALAILRAQKLRAAQEEQGLTPEQANPYTTVDLLVAELRRYDREVLRRRAELVLLRLRRRRLPVTAEEEADIRACQRAALLDEWEERAAWVPEVSWLRTGAPPEPPAVARAPDDPASLTD